MTTYPHLTFSRQKAKPGWQRSRYKVRTPDGVELGEVYSPYLGGWKVIADGKELPGGYATRYEAGYSLYTMKMGRQELNPRL